MGTLVQSHSQLEESSPQAKTTNKNQKKPKKSQINSEPFVFGRQNRLLKTAKMKVGEFNSAKKGLY